MSSSHVKLHVSVPVSHADIVRQAMGDAGAGVLGNYSHCSFSSRGIGRYKGNSLSNPFIGSAGQLEATEEERIQVTVERSKLQAVIAAIRSVHPYEEISMDVYALEDISAYKAAP